MTENEKIKAIIAEIDDCISYNERITQLYYSGIIADNRLPSLRQCKEIAQKHLGETNENE